MIRQHVTDANKQEALEALRARGYRLIKITRGKPGCWYLWMQCPSTM